MADKEISALTAATTPLAGTELVHIDQGGNSRKATLSDVAAIATGAMLKAEYDPDANGIIAVAQGGTNAATASDARVNLGLGTMAVQAANNVNISGGVVTGITDLAVADGGTGASNASTARANLGLAIGTDVQAYSANLAGFAATTVANVQNRDNHTGTQLAATISDFSTAADLRVSAAIGSTVQAYSALLDSVSALSLTAGDFIYATGEDAVAVLPAGASGQVLAVDDDGVPAWGTELVVGGLLAANDLSDVDDAETARDNLGLEIGADVQAYSANLATLSGITPGATGQEILAGSTAEDVRDTISLAKPVSTKAAIRALDWTKYDTFSLYENDRERNFKKVASDLSATLLGSAIASSAVDSGTETITSVAHGLVTGDAVVTTTAVNGLSLNTIYFAIRVDADNFKLATSHANAWAGTAFNLTGTTATTVKKHFDHLQALYITPDSAIDGSLGALKALDIDDWLVEWFGTSTGSNNFSPYAHALVTAMNQFGPKKVRWGYNSYSLENELPVFVGFIVDMEGYGFGGTVISSLITQTDDDRGVFHFTTHAPRLRGFNITDSLGGTGGTAITLQVPGNNAMIGRPAITDNILGGPGFKYALLTDGDLFNTGGGGAPRAGMIYGNYLHGGSLYTWELRSCKHSMLGPNQVSSSGAAGYGGTSNCVHFTGTAVGTAQSEDNQMYGIINGNLVFDNCTECVVDCKVYGNITFASTASLCHVTQPNTGFSLTNSNTTSCSVTQEPYRRLMADDTAWSITMPSQSCIVAISCDSGPTASASPNYMFALRSDVASFGTATNFGLATNVAFSTTLTLAGTTGTDGNFTLSKTTAGALQLENRAGGNRTVRVAFLTY